jgi:hypothetical protein
MSTLKVTEGQRQGLRDRQTERNTDTEINRQRDRQQESGRYKDIHSERQADREREKKHTRIKEKE